MCKCANCRLCTTESFCPHLHINNFIHQRSNKMRPFAHLHICTFAHSPSFAHLHICTFAHFPPFAHLHIRTFAHSLRQASLRSLPFAACISVMLLFTACHSAKPTANALPKAASVAHTSTAASMTISPPPLSYAQQRQFDELFLESVRQKEAEHIDAQFELLNAALQINPLADEALYEMGVLKLSYTTYSDTLSRQQGDSLLRKAVQLAPDNPYYKETLATYLANSAKYQEAINLYEELAEGHETDEILSTLIWLYKTSGDFAGAIRTIERLERTNGKSEALSMEKFQTFLAMKDDEHAYQAIEDLCAEYPYDLRYRVLLGDLYDQHGYHEQALDIYRDVLTAEPDNSYAQISLLAYYKAAGADSLYLDLLNRVVLNPRTQSGARLEAMRGYAVDNLRQHADSTPVLQLFRKALSQPQESRDMAELQAYYISERRMPTDSLLQALYTLLNIEPDYTKARLQVLQIMLQRGNMEQVAVTCREGELYDPNEVTFYYYEGIALYRMGRDRDAIATLQRGVERIDESTDRQLASDIYALLGDVLHGHGLKEEAYLAYDRALEYNELNLDCLNNYAYFLSLDNKQLSKAERMSRRTVEARGNDPTYLDTYAWILYLKRDYAQARIYIEEALRFAPDASESASLYDHAGDILLRLADRRQAASYWRKALQLTTDRTLKRTLKRKLYRR